MPSASVSGLCKINGRSVYLTGQDFTVRGGSLADALVGLLRVVEHEGELHLGDLDLAEQLESMSRPPASSESRVTR